MRRLGHGLIIICLLAAGGGFGFGPIQTCDSLHTGEIHCHLEQEACRLVVNGLRVFRHAHPRWPAPETAANIPLLAVSIDHPPKA